MTLASTSIGHRSLHGFEFTPVEALARDFVLIILDHPFAGDIVAQGCLQPLDDVLNAGSAFVGPSLETYSRAGRLWAIPVDAAWAQNVKNVMSA